MHANNIIIVTLLESFTADHKPLLGEDPELRGFYHGCGFNSGGMMLSEYCAMYGAYRGHAKKR